MSVQLVGQLHNFGFGFAPKGWLPCDGRLLLVSQYVALFSLIGMQYGGNGTTNFAIPNLQGRVPVGQGTCEGYDYQLGQTMGVESASINGSEMPAHRHQLMATSDEADATNPVAASLAAAEIWAGVSPNTPTNRGCLTTVGQGQPHENMQPSLVLNWCIAVEGQFPARA